MEAQNVHIDDEAPLPLRTVIAGRYRVEALISLGGTSYVYRAIDLTLGRAVALKIILKALIGHSRRFEREARAMAALEHPAVVRIYGIGELEDGRPYLVLEFVPGETLGSRLKRDGSLPPKMAAGFLAPIVGALVEAHAVGICHRDVKPDNMMIQPMRGGRPSVRVLDFGIAGFDLDSGPRLTRSGQIMGTPEYMAPEQAAGEESGEAADVWACGVVLYQMLTGRVPFTGNNTPEILYHLLNTPHPPVGSDVDPSLGSLINDCLRKRPEDRPSTASILGQLETFLLGAVTMKLPSLPTKPSAQNAPSLEPLPPVEPYQVPKRSPWIVLGLLIGIGLGVAGARLTGSTDQQPTTHVQIPPPPLDTLRLAETLLDAGEGKAALEWIKSKTPEPATPEWKLLLALAQLKANHITEGLAELKVVLKNHPDLRTDRRVLPEVIDTLRFKRGKLAVALLTGPLVEFSAEALQKLAATGLNQRARGRAITALEMMGLDVTEAKRLALRAKLKAHRCKDRKEAVEQIVASNDLESLPLLQELTRHPSENRCMSDTLSAGIRQLQGEPAPPPKDRD